jgi:hypothetical protein
VSLKPKFSKAEWIILLVTAAMLSMVVFTGCEGREIPPPPPAPVVGLPADMPSDAAGRIAWLTGEMAKAKAQEVLARASALQKITDAQIKWATWAAGAAFLLGAVMLALSFTLGIPKKFGVIGMVLGAGLLIAARVWSKFSDWAPLTGILIVVGGAASLLYILYLNRDAIKAKLAGK